MISYLTLFCLVYVLLCPSKCGRENDNTRFDVYDETLYQKTEIEELLKRKNFVLYDIPEPRHEGIHDLLEAVLDILTNMMKSNVTALEIDNVMRLGFLSRSTLGRPVLVKCHHKWRRDDIMSRARYLNGKGIYIEEDLPKKAALARRKSKYAGKSDAFQETSTVRKKMPMMEYLEHLNRKRNFIMCGVAQEGNETKRELLKIVLHILNDIMRLDVERREILFCKRLGNRTGRNVIQVKCFNQWRKNDIWRNRLKLIGTKIYIEHQLRPDILEKRGRLHNEMNRHLGQNHTANRTRLTGLDYSEIDHTNTQLGAR